MMGDVVMLDVETRLDIPPSRVLQCAIDAKLEKVIVIGVGPDGVYHASSTTDAADMLLRLKMFERALLRRLED